MRVDEPIKLISSEFFQDWYVIERKNASKEKKIVEFEWGSFSWPVRWISDACVEGTKEEMIDIARGILNTEEVKFNRCAVVPGPFMARDCFIFYSPRNSQDYGEVPREYAIQFALEVLGRFNDVL